MKVNINTLKENERNPRNITEVKMELLIDSILTFPKMLSLRPIVVDSSMTVLGGNMRTRALKRIANMDLDEVMARLEGHNDYEKKNDAEKKEIADHWAQWLNVRTVEIMKANELSDEEQQRFIIEDNASFGQWDWDMLANEWNSEDLNNWGVDVWNSEAEEESTESGVASEDDFDEEKDCIEVRCKKGDVWQLGEHRLMCGDSTSRTDVAELMDGHKADIAFTSPPYNMGNDVGKAVERSKNLRMAYIGKDGAYNEYSDSLSDADYSKLLNNALDAALANADDVLFNIGILAGSKFGIIDMMHQHIDKFCDILVWKKKNCIPMGMQDGLIAHLCEFVFCFNKNGNRAFKHPQWKKCVFDGAMMTNVIETKNQCNNEYSKVHHATFPVEFASEVIRRFSKESVLDQFGGTGTTLIACEQLNRKCYMMELDPHYCDVIIARWEKLTGKTATRIETETE